MVTEHDPRRSRPLRASPAACCSPAALLAQFAGEDTPEMRAKFIAWTPLGRLPLPSDIATAALFFASDEAAFITGACLEVDGGRCV
jgi:3-oxoacyl-[acyl-carrier protein] reductase